MPITFEIEDDDSAVGPAISAAIADEAAPGSGSERDAVGVLLAGDVGDCLAGQAVNHQSMGGSRHVEPVGCRVEGEVIPGALTTDFKGIDDSPCGAGGLL